MRVSVVHPVLYNRTRMTTEAPVIKPSRTHRTAVRRVLREARKGALATAMADGGAPYASLVTVATDQGGSPLFLLSTLADHTRNLLVDPRASLLVEGRGGAANPQEVARATLMGRVERSDDPADRARFLARHPAAGMYAGFGDFAIYRMTPERAHYVGGFARAVWIPDGLTVPEEAAMALKAAEAGILAHMNDDHADAVARYARCLLGATGEGPWRLVGCDADGCDIACDEQVLRLSFQEPANGPEDVHRMLVSLAREARSADTGPPSSAI